MGNHLAGATSPYLQQHADNPVAWYPWGDEPFARAREEDKPVLLSIGYSTCHWCHVMAHESFEDEEVAEVLNRTFICIKLDREERPDLDAVYMQAAQVLTGSGGWPLNVLLTPDRKPFHAFTYLPKRTRFGHLGLIEMAEQIDELWQNERTRVERAAGALTKAVGERVALAMPASKQAAAVDAAYQQLAGLFDQEHGGFGEAPKFPSVHQLLFLLRYGELRQQPHAVEMVGRTLEAMRRGGIHDHLGGGFHRYATDAEWRLPHFEKMLYDQAMLLLAYSEAWLVTNNEQFANTARGIADYLLRDMRDEGGGFYAAEDADSEGEEGRFYLWRLDEVVAVLGKDADAFTHAFGLMREGNVSDEATGRRNGTNVLLLSNEQAMVPEQIAAAKQRLFEVRGQRIRPFRDDKVLTDWNGLAIAALAVAGRVLDEPRHLQAAESAARFVLAHMRTEEGVMHSWRDGKAAIPACLNDYTHLVWGLIELYEATLDATWLREALALNAEMEARFAGPDGGYYMSAAGAELIARPMESIDGALPSGNSVAMHNQLRLARLTGNSALEERASAIASRFAGLAERMPQGLTHLLSGMLLASAPSQEIVLSGDRNTSEAVAMLHTIHSRFHPLLTLLWRDAEIEQLAPFVQELPAGGDIVTASICENYVCHLPLTSVDALARMLEGEGQL